MKDELNIALLNCEGTDSHDWCVNFNENLMDVFHYIHITNVKIDIVNTIGNTSQDYRVYLVIASRDTILSGKIEEQLNLLEYYQNNDRLNAILLLKEPLDPSISIAILGKYPLVNLYYYQAETQSYITYQFGEESQEASSWISLLDIGNEIRTQLYPVKNQEKEIRNIYLAETTNDQQFYRQNLKRELEHWGFTVLPKHMLPQNYEILKEQVRAYMEKSIISIHILGNEYGQALQGTEKSVIELQNEIAVDYIKSNSTQNNNVNSTFRFVWINPDIDDISTQQNNYIHTVKTHLEFLEKTEIIQTPLESLKTVIKERLKFYRKLPQRTLKAKPGELKVYLMSEDYSVPLIDSLETELRKYNAILLKLSSDIPGENLYSLHKQYLLEAQAVMIYYPAENSQWLNSKLSDILKAPGFGRDNPFTFKGLLAPRDLSENLNLRSDIMLMKMEEQQLTSSLLTPFIQTLEKRNYEAG